MPAPTQPPTCAECGAPMVLRTARKGPGAGRCFWGCSTFPRCRATHGAHPDGRPLGVPGDRATKAARIRAHDAFDPIWRSGVISRSGAYRWMRRALGLSEAEAHIGRFTIAQCDALIAAVAQRGKGRVFTLHGDAATEAEERGLRGDLDGWQEIGDYDTSGMDLPDDH